MKTIRNARPFGGLLLGTLGVLSALALSAPAGQEGRGERLPAAVDLRPRFEAAGLTTRAQGARPTCSVFAVSGALEYALARRGLPGKTLSVDFLNWASNQASGENEDGSYFSDLWRGFELYGVCDEADLPYRGEFDPQWLPGPEARARAAERRGLGLWLHWIKEWDVQTGLTDEEFAGIKRALAKGWPVSGGFRWPKQASWTHGVLDWALADGVRDGHSVLLAGYRDDPRQPGGGVFFVRDSGRGSRGEALSYEYVRAYMNDAIWIGFEEERAPAPAAAETTGSSSEDLDLSLVNPLGPPVVGRNRRFSSNEPPWHDANLDMDWLMPGDSVDVPLLEGPGVITHLWFTSHSGWVNELNSLVLRIWYDGNATPAVEAPLGDFFAVGQGRPASVESLPVQVSPTGSLSCFWRMPFRKSAHVTITNDNPDRSTGLYWQIDWTRVEELSPRTPYFYAKFRREHPAVGGRDYTIADLAGNGLFVGTVYSVTMAQDGWFGEGDDFFYIDGEEVPSLQGTGSEDYFNDAWGFRVRTGPYFGQPRWEGYTTGSSTVCYRWHLADPVFFTRSLLFEIEHKGNLPSAIDGFYVERPDFISSVAFWYQTGEPKPFGELPPWPERRVPWQDHHLVKQFRQARATGPARVKVLTEGAFGMRPVLAWPNEEPGASLTLPFELAEGGRFATRLVAATGPGRGAYDVAIDGEKVRTAEFRAAEEGSVELPLGTHRLEAGEHTISFRPSAQAEEIGALGVETLRLLKLPPEARRGERTHHEAHFIRLAIGRAVYAYRLALGELPDSLQTLVDSDFMPERYLRDENELPLKSWVAEGSFHVESPGQDHWRHSWKGLDARR